MGDISLKDDFLYLCLKSIVYNKLGGFFLKGRVIRNYWRKGYILLFFSIVGYLIGDR